MSKKKSKKKKKEDKEKQEETSEKETEETEEESFLEEKIDSVEEEINTKQFQNFMQHDFHIIPQEIEIDEVKAPVLERINAPQSDTFVRLEEGVGEADFDRTKKSDEDDPSKYSIGGEGSTEEPKYQKNYDEIRAPNITDITTLGKNPFSERPEIGFKSSEEKLESVNREEYTPVKMQDLQKLGKENPLEKKDVKYTPSKY